ncbi:MAG: hypothetical protein IPG50_30825 [Myxococcales bacterium]|nr:hypothetical protein [Myxococcales bacterium]
MSELTLLRVLLLLAMAMGPLGTHRFFFAEQSRLRVGAHVLALACAALGLFLDAPVLCGAWLLFCAGSFALFLGERASREGAAALRSPDVLAASVPFLFSNIAAVWLVGGANDLRILGYGTAFSYYAALHGNVLGWILVGALAGLAQRGGPERRVYLASVLVCLVSFLLLAFGIDQLRALKPLGVVGLSLALPASQLAFLRSVWPTPSHRLRTRLRQPRRPRLHDGARVAQRALDAGVPRRRWAPRHGLGPRHDQRPHRRAVLPSRRQARPGAQKLNPT